MYERIKKGSSQYSKYQQTIQIGKQSELPNAKRNQDKKVNTEETSATTLIGMKRKLILKFLRSSMLSPKKDLELQIFWD